MSISKHGVIVLLKAEIPRKYAGGIFLKRACVGEHENVAILIAIGVNEDGYREVLGAEGMKEDKQNWKSFFLWLKERSLTGATLIIQ